MTEAIRCKCGQLLAERQRGGGRVARGVAVRWDERGRIVVYCPACHARRRIPNQRLASREGRHLRVE